MKTELFNYYLPKELIAQVPSEKRDESRLIVLLKGTGEILHKKFYEITDFLKAGDVLVLNDTKVIPARVFGNDKRRREILLIREVEPLMWESFIKPQRGLIINEELSFEKDSLRAIIVKRTEIGTYLIKFNKKPALSDLGYAPLPPYIKRDYEKPDLHEYDKVRYQTIYAGREGAIAAPTAGMHFTNELLKKIEDKGINIVKITLHVGIGTFRPVRAEFIKDHIMLPEWYDIPSETTETLKNAKRIIAVGTTTVRTLETSTKGSGYTNLFIYPPFDFKVTSGLITNFHLPKSTLLMLVSAFAGRELIIKAYSEAVRNKYRFFSYGDAMLIL